MVCACASERKKKLFSITLSFLFKRFERRQDAVLIINSKSWQDKKRRESRARVSRRKGNYRLSRFWIAEFMSSTYRILTALYINNDTLYPRASFSSSLSYLVRLPSAKLIYPIYRPAKCEYKIAGQDLELSLHFEESFICCGSSSFSKESVHNSRISPRRTCARYKIYTRGTRYKFYHITEIVRCHDTASADPRCSQYISSP